MSSTLGINQHIKGPVDAAVEVFAQHGAGQKQVSLDFTTVWTATRDMEIDLNANVGMTRQTPALELIVGISHRF